jgi:hypothetical protein
MKKKKRKRKNKKRKKDNFDPNTTPGFAGGRPGWYIGALF